VAEAKSPNHQNTILLLKSPSMTSCLLKHNLTKIQQKTPFQSATQ
jgi:hypothetical protein